MRLGLVAKARTAARDVPEIQGRHRDVIASGASSAPALPDYADADANLRELMDRMGHSTTRAAMVYLHGSDERQQAIADALSKQAADDLGRSKKRRSGAQRHGGGGGHRGR